MYVILNTVKEITHNEVQTRKEIIIMEKTKEVKKATIDFKATANSIVSAFQSNKNVDVIADTDMEKGPRNTTMAEYRYIHFFKPGTTKDMFGCYIVSKGRVRFALNLAVEQYLDKGLSKKDVEKTVKGEKRKVAVDVYCDIQDAISTAKLIVAAYQSIPVIEKKVKKAEPKQTPAKKAEKVKTEKAKKPAAPKKNITAKRSKKAVATA